MNEQYFRGYMNLKYIIALVSFSLFSSASMLGAEALSEEKSIPAKNTSCSALLIHGLNLRADKMGALAGVFERLGCKTKILELSGSQKGDDDLSKISESAWLEQIENAAHALQEELPGKPFYLLGYSLGGLLSLRALDSSELRADHIFLFAPAIGLPFSSQLARPLTWLRHLGLSLISFGVEDYLAKDATPFASYRVMYDSYDVIQEPKNLEKLQKLSYSIFMSEEDELVSASKVRGWFKEKQIENWKYYELKPEPTLEDSLEHLVIDEPSLGREMWKKVQQLIERAIEKEA